MKGTPTLSTSFDNTDWMAFSQAKAYNNNADIVRKLLKVSGKSMKEVSEGTGIGLKRLREIYNERSFPTLHELSVLSRYLGRTLSFSIRELTSKPSPEPQTVRLVMGNKSLTLTTEEFVSDVGARALAEMEAYDNARGVSWD